MPNQFSVSVVAAILMLWNTGCTRDRYHRAADRDTLNILDEKTSARPWDLPPNYSINVDPRSRLFDDSDPNDPQLPDPGPNLYAYDVPQLRSDSDAPGSASDDSLVPDFAATTSGGWTARREPIVPVVSGSIDGWGPRTVQPVWHTTRQNAPSKAATVAQPYADAEVGLTIQPIPREYWDAIPLVCLSRMFEFESVREEYRRTYNTDPPKEMRDQARKLTFTDIVGLAQLNSREYQSQKEALYSAALGLTRERYRYQTKFSAAGNGTSSNYDHTRDAGVKSNTLTVPSTVSGDRVIALGGTAVARFANSVVMTFGGPQGFAKDISSNLLFEFTQSVFQRDVLLEPLIQTERNVVYAGRRFARYRKQFYFGLSNTYYQDLLSTYRSIEINTQNYFGVVRALDQAEAEVRSGVNSAQPRFQVDQIEQNMLSGRRSLINSCNSLENSLDRFKLTLGIPTETAINIDLRELESLTLRDEMEVAGELVRRARERVRELLEKPRVDREDVVSTNLVLLDRTLGWMELRERIGLGKNNVRELRVLRAAVRVDEAYVSVDRAQRQLAETQDAVPPAAPINVFRRTANAIQARLQLTARQLQHADQLSGKGAVRETVLKAYVAQKARAEATQARVTKVLRGESDEKLEVLQKAADTSLAALVTLEPVARGMVGAPAKRSTPAEELKQSIEQGQQLLVLLDKLGADASSGLPKIEMSVDDAMVTALVQRFDLMDQRGRLADDWRGIKLAADDLKSALNLNVSHSLSARDGRAFDFGAEDSQTELRAAVDLPLNRRSQRNGFRQSLINYQVGRRSLMELEDNIKFAARQDLRQLSLDRVQYDISVISAALASERVYSTQLELSLGLATVTARDFLEAQRDYRANLSSVANGRLGYIVNRAKLAFDLELMLLDDAGLWPELNQEQYQPVSNGVFPPNAGPTYGELPEGVWPSTKIKRMQGVRPPG